MLTNSTYAGEGRFNRTDSRTRARKAEAEHISFKAPVIIEAPTFERAQAFLRERNPSVTPPRVVSGPVLLSGLARCASCGGAMSLRTRTSKTGKVHRYYACSTCARQGKGACKGRSIPIDRLDDLVTDQIIDRLLQPQRLEALLATLAARRAERSTSVDERILALEQRAVEADQRLRRLYRMVEDDVTELDDLLKDRLAALKSELEVAHTALERIRGTNRAPIVIPGDRIAAFGALMRERLTTGDVPFRKAYLGALIDRVEVDDDQVRNFGRKDVLEQAVLAIGGPMPGVRSFVRRW